VETQSYSAASALAEAACKNRDDPVPAVEAPPRPRQEQPGAHGTTPDDEREALALLRRALVEADDLAWQEVYARYRPLVTAWARRITADPDEVEAAVHAAFARLWRAIDPQKFARFPTLSSLLQYLKLCVRGAVLDARRARAAQAVAQSWEELLARHHVDRPDLATDLEGQLLHGESRRELWALLRRELPDERERVLLSLACVAGLPPHEIQRRYPAQFGSVEEIYRLKWAICERLRRCETLRAWWLDQ